MNLTLEEQLQEYWREVNKVVTKKLIPAHIPIPINVTDHRFMWDMFLNGISSIIKGERIYAPQESLSGKHSLKQFTPEELRLWQTHWESAREFYEHSQRISLQNRGILQRIYESLPAPARNALAEQYGGILTKSAALIGIPAILLTGTFAGIAKAFSLDILPFDFNNNDNNSYQPDNQHILYVEEASKHEAGLKPKNPKENYAQQTGSIASIALQPAPKLSYASQAAQTGDQSNGTVTGDQPNNIIPVELPCMPQEILGDLPKPPPGVDVCDETASLTDIIAQTGEQMQAVTGDVTNDGRVGAKDLVYIARNLNRSTFPSTADLTSDARIDVQDLAVVGLNFGRDINPVIPPPIDFNINDVVLNPVDSYTGHLKTIFDRAYFELTGSTLKEVGIEIVFQDIGKYLGLWLGGNIIYINPMLPGLELPMVVGIALEILGVEVLGGYHAHIIDRPLPEGTGTTTDWTKGRSTIYQSWLMQHLQENYGLNMKLRDTPENIRLLRRYPQDLLGATDSPGIGQQYAWDKLFRTPELNELKAELDGPNAELSAASLRRYINYLNSIEPRDLHNYNQEVANWVSSVVVRRVSSTSTIDFEFSLYSLLNP